MPESGEGQHTTGVADEPNSRAAADYYALLGIAPSAGHDEIRHAFHSAAKQWHPDRYMRASDDERAHAERQMRALIAAYGVLSDPGRRALYDAQRRDHARAEHDPAHEGSGAPQAADWAVTAEEHEAYDRLYANSDPSGVASFLGVLLGLMALGSLRLALGGTGIASYLGLTLALVLGATALWCFLDPAGLARAAERLAPRTPPQKARPPQHHAATSQQQREAAREDAAAQREEQDAEFERLVDEAVASIPDEFKQYMQNVVVRVRHWPTAEERRTMQLREGETLFGLYHGVMLTHQGAHGAGPEVITIYQRPIERYCEGDPERMRDQVRRTVLHELAHHFGMDHEAMPDWIR